MRVLADLVISNKSDVLVILEPRIVVGEVVGFSVTYTFLKFCLWKLGDFLVVFSVFGMRSLFT